MTAQNHYQPHYRSNMLEISFVVVHIIERPVLDEDVFVRYKVWRMKRRFTLCPLRLNSVIKFMTWCSPSHIWLNCGALSTLKNNLRGG